MFDAGEPDTSAVLRPNANRAVNLFVVLVRHFLARFVDRDSLGSVGRPEATLAQLLGILAAPGAIFALVLQIVTLRGWAQVTFRFWFVSFSMIVTGIVMVFRWDSLFPDRRDYQILTPLPLSPFQVFFAKVTALALLILLMLAVVNIPGAILWPGIDGGNDLGPILLSHLAAEFAAGIFIALAIAALQGILVTALPPALFRRVSVALQTALMTALVLFFFLTPILGEYIQNYFNSGKPVVTILPPYWFVGLYEHMRPVTGDPRLLQLGDLGLWALAVSFALFLLSYLQGYRRHCHKALESFQPDPSGPSAISTLLQRLAARTFLTNPIELGVFRYITATIVRSPKHRLFLATYGGFGAAMAFLDLRSGHDGLLELPLTLSFTLVSGLRAAFNYPAEPDANWAFQMSEVAGPGGYLAATRKWILCAVLPLFLLLAPGEIANFGPVVASMHIAFGVTLSVLLADLLFLDFRKVPFTCTFAPGKANLIGLGVAYIFGFTTYSRVMAQLEAWLTPRPMAALGFFGLSAAAALLIARWRRRSIREGGPLEFDDPGDPVVRTLLGVAPH